MVRYRTFKKYGGSDIIQLKPTDKEDLGLEYGDEVDIEDVVIKKKE